MKAYLKTNSLSASGPIPTNLKRLKTYFALALTLLFSLTIILIYTYFMTYEAAKEQILDVGVEMFTKV